jgi:excisionase family DNA binding protein
MAEQPTPLYVRLAAEQARRLDQAAASSGKSKRQLIEDAVRVHLTDDGLVVGHAQLHEDAPAVLTAAEAAALLRVDERQLAEAAARGDVPGRRIGAEWRFSREALLAWLRGESVPEG